jgi:hypothetical protein
MSPRDQPVRMRKLLLMPEKFEPCGKMGPGLRREGDQKHASIPILPQALRASAGDLRARFMHHSSLPRSRATVFTHFRHRAI